MTPSDQSMTGPAFAPGSRSRRIRRVALAAALGGGLALGAAGLAYADETSTPPSAPPSAPASPSGAAPGPAAAEGKHRPHLDGTVKQIGAGKITIVDREGFTRQINTTKVPDGVVVGTRIHAEGTVNADGVSLDATSVGVAPRPGPDGKRPGPGGPGGGARPGPKPAGKDGGAPAGPPPAPGSAPAQPLSGAPAAPAPVPSSVAPAPTS